jgi:hypothetical protein
MNAPTPSQQTPRPDAESDFAKAAAAPRTGIVSEFTSFLGENKKWWLAPIVVVLLLLGVLLILGGTGAMPFIYTLF